MSARVSPSLEELAADPEVRAALARIPRMACAASPRPPEPKSSPDFSHKRSVAMKASHARPEVKAKISAATRARWADPIYREQAIAGQGGANPGIRRHWADPEWRAKQCARIAAGKARRRAELKQTL